MVGIVRGFIVKYLSALAMDELELLVREIAQLPCFEPFARMISNAYQAKSLLQEPAAADATKDEQAV